MIAQTIKGATYVVKGFTLLKLPGIRRYVAIPAMINIFLFTAAIWYGYEQIDTLLEQYLPSWLDWLEFYYGLYSLSQAYSLFFSHLH